MIIHVDMDAFYASVEEREQPELVGKAVVVGGPQQGRGVVSAANYVARKHGIHSAMPMARAQRLCADLVCLPVRMGLYAEVSQQVRSIFHRYTPQVEPLSLDEAFLDANASERLFGDSVKIGRAIKQDIAEELSLVASVGVAPNKYLAKVASDLDKPNGFVVVEPGTEQAFLDPLPVSRLWGVGKATGEVFKKLGIHTIGQVRRQSQEFLQFKFGKQGNHLWELAHGIDDRPVVSEQQAKSISHETTFAEDISDTAILRAWLLHLTEQVAWRLRRNELRGRTVHIKLRFPNFKTVTRSHTLDEATHTTDILWQTANEMFTHVLSKGQPVRLLGMGVSGLGEMSDVTQIQQDLFAVKSDKQDVIDALSDNINSRFGTSAIKRGAVYKRSH